MRACLRPWCLALVLVTQLTLVTAASGFVWLVTDRLPQALPRDGTGLVTTGRDSAPAAATVSGDLVSLLERGPDGTLRTLGTFLAEAPLSAVAIDDVDQDGQWELLSARGEEGALGLDRWLQGRRLPVGAPRYAWSPITAIQVASTRSGIAVVAAGEAGGLFTYLVSGRGLEPAGVTKPEQRFELFGAADLDGDGQEELVVGSGRSEVAILRWTPGTGWAYWWQNFPWGGLAGAAVGDLDGDGWPELAIASQERLLYVFGKSKEGTSLTLRHQGPLALPGDTLGLACWSPASGPGGEEEGPDGGVVVYGPHELRFIFFSRRLERLAEEKTVAVSLKRLLPLAGGPQGTVGWWPRFLLARGDGALELVAAVRQDRLKLVWLYRDGQTVPVATRLTHGGRVYVSLREVAEQLGVVVRWDEGRRAAEATPEAGGAPVELAVGRVPRLGGEPVPEAGLVMAETGRMFLEVRGIERLFPPGEGGRPRLMVVAGSRRWPADSLW